MFEKIQQKKVQIDENGITYKNRHYSFSDIRHIFFARMLTTERMNFVKVGQPETTGLSLTMTDGTEIEVTFDERSIFIGMNKNRKDDINNLIKVYLYLSQITFQNRLSFYENQIRNQGYFVIGDCKLYPRSKIVYRNQEFPVETTNFFKGYGIIEFRKKDFGWKDRLKRELSSKVPHIITLTDADVVFHILEKYFGLKWNN